MDFPYAILWHCNLLPRLVYASICCTMSSIKLKTSDKKEVMVDRDLLVKWSRPMGDMLEACPDTGEIPFENIDERTMKKIVGWCEHHQHDNPGYLGVDMGMGDKVLRLKSLHDIPQWDERFLNGTTMNEMCYLLQATSLLEMDDLQNILGRLLARQLQGKDEGEMESLLHSAVTGNNVIH
uniref:Skp1_POZ domain-containing protein n=1 Tax=Steinernema glaseri TaxID=37863 RepID=A0A1I8ANB4_9BILA